MTYSEILGKRILSLCEQRIWSINLVASLADLPHSTVNNIVINKHKNPSIVTVHSIAKAFDMSINEFLDMPELHSLTMEELNSMKPKRKSPGTMKQS